MAEDYQSTTQACPGLNATHFGTVRWETELVASSKDGSRRYGRRYEETVVDGNSNVCAARGYGYERGDGVELGLRWTS